MSLGSGGLGRGDIWQNDQTPRRLRGYQKQGHVSFIRGGKRVVSPEGS